ncbi:MAG: DNA-directed RNA polymerase subunit alpha C-terminal domain-containing protein, partial [Fidelibacterota bacterium]
KKASFTMELRIGKGRGYVPAEKNKIPDQPLGPIFIDSIFSPVLNVSYSVEEYRIGGKGNYEKLTIEVTTDGSITPDDALTYAAKVLRDQLQIFINFEVETEEEEEPIEIDEDIIRIRKQLKRSIDELELSVRSYNCLQAANIKTIADLVSKDESEMLKFKNFGRKSLTELIEKLGELGLHFGMDVNKYFRDNGN